MPWTVTLAGRSFSNANLDGTAYADEADGFPAILRAFAEEAAFLKGLATTSATEVTPAPGPVVLTTHQDAGVVALPAGALVRAVGAADPARYMIGAVSSFEGTTLTLDVTLAAGGSGADWVIGYPVPGRFSLSGDPAPALAAPLDAAGNAIVNAGNLRSYAETLGAALALAASL